MIEKYRKETIDIEDVEFEEVNLELNTFFSSDKTTEDCDERAEKY